MEWENKQKKQNYHSHKFLHITYTKSAKKLQSKTQQIIKKIKPITNAVGHDEAENTSSQTKQKPSHTRLINSIHYKHSILE